MPIALGTASPTGQFSGIIFLKNIQWQFELPPPLLVLLRNPGKRLLLSAIPKGEEFMGLATENRGLQPCHCSGLLSLESRCTGDPSLHPTGRAVPETVPDQAGLKHQAPASSQWVILKCSGPSLCKEASRSIRPPSPWLSARGSSRVVVGGGGELPASSHWTGLIEQPARAGQLAQPVDGCNATLAEPVLGSNLITGKNQVL